MLVFEVEYQEVERQRQICCHVQARVMVKIEGTLINSKN
jgi:hypothetical protein